MSAVNPSPALSPRAAPPAVSAAAAAFVCAHTGLFYAKTESVILIGGATLEDGAEDGVPGSGGAGAGAAAMPSPWRGPGTSDSSDKLDESDKLDLSDRFGLGASARSDRSTPGHGGSPERSFGEDGEPQLDCTMASVRSDSVCGGGPKVHGEHFLLPDMEAQNNFLDEEAAVFFYRRCQELGVALVVVSRHLSHACRYAMPPLPREKGFQSAARGRGARTGLAWRGAGCSLCGGSALPGRAHTALPTCQRPLAHPSAHPSA